MSTPIPPFVQINQSSSSESKPQSQVSIKSNDTATTIDNAMEQIQFGPFQIYLTLSCGLTFMSDAIQVNMMSFLSLVLTSLWSLTPSQTSTLPSTVFGGMFLGSIVWGGIADTWGRRKAFLIISWCIAGVSICTATAKGLNDIKIWLLLMGISISGFVIPFDLLAEFSPNYGRARRLLLLNYFWALGSTLVPLIAAVTIGREQERWRVMVVTCGVPCVASALVGVKFAMESPRWLVEKGYTEEAKKVLREVERYNEISPQKAVVKEEFAFATEPFHPPPSNSAPYSHCLTLLTPRYRTTTLTLWPLWFFKSFTYYGNVLLTTKVFGKGEDFDNDFDDGQFDYGKVLISASSEFFATTLLIFLVPLYGRSTIGTVAYASSGIFLLLFSLSTSIVFGVLARFALVVAVNITWVHTPELYGTDIRSTGHSICSAMSRIGALLSPFLVYNFPTYVSGFVFLITASAAGLLSSNLPETKGKSLGETSMSTEGKETELFQGKVIEIPTRAHDYRQMK